MFSGRFPVQNLQRAYSQRLFGAELSWPGFVPDVRFRTHEFYRTEQTEQAFNQLLQSYRAGCNFNRACRFNQQWNPVWNQAAVSGSENHAMELWLDCSRLCGKKHQSGFFASGSGWHDANQHRRPQPAAAIQAPRKSGRLSAQHGWRQSGNRAGFRA